MSQIPMITFNREIYPVGQGGFAFESLEGYSVVFDCGSYTSPTRVSLYIDGLKTKVKNKIDRLYISHFDEDHVNSIKELIQKVGVKEAVIPYIPKTYHVVYDVITRGAYSAIREALQPAAIIEPQQDDIFNKGVWEWIARPMLSVADWTNLNNHFQNNSIDLSRLTDPVYVESFKEIINNCFKDAFGKKGPNSKGLILLSQKRNGQEIKNLITINKIEKSVQITAALYTGDADLISKQNVSETIIFLQLYLKNKLLFVQIPHHGSNLNSGRHFDSAFPSYYYFYNDKSDERLKKNKLLYSSLTNANSLLDVRDICKDLIQHKVEIM